MSDSSEPKIEIRHKITGDVLFSVKRETLKGIDLSGYELSYADLSGQNMSNAKLTGTILMEADLDDAILIKANLTDADCRFASMIRVQLGEAELAHAKFNHANLHGANLTGAKNLTPLQVGGANLTGISPLDILKFDGLSHADECIKNTARILLGMLAACAFCVLTANTTQDAQLIMANGNAKLPVLDVEISIRPFFFLAPFLLLCAYAVFHLDLLRTWEALVDLPAIFPDGKPLDRKTQPWLLNGVLRQQMPRLRDQENHKHTEYNPTPMAWLRATLFGAMAYTLVPISLIFFWSRFLPVHDTRIGWHIVLIAMSIALLLDTKRLSRTVLQGNQEERLRWMQWWRWRHIHRRGARLAVCLVTASLLGYVSHFAIVGNAVEDNDEFSWRPEWLVPKLLSFVGIRAFANMRGVDFSTSQFNGLGHTNKGSTEKGHIDMSHLDLRYADMSYANLEGADFSGSLLTGANFARANLTNVDFSTAWLRKNNFTAAKVTGIKWKYIMCEECSLAVLDLNGADLQECRLKKCNFLGSQLKHANLSLAHLDGSWFKKADLSDSHLEGANLSNSYLGYSYLSRTHLEGADLSGASINGRTLDGANMTKAKLENSFFSSVDLRKVSGLTWQQIVSAKDWNAAEANWPGVVLPAYLLNHPPDPKTINMSRQDFSKSLLILKSNVAKMKRIDAEIKEDDRKRQRAREERLGR